MIVKICLTIAILLVYCLIQMPIASDYYKDTLYELILAVSIACLGSSLFVMTIVYIWI